MSAKEELRQLRLLDKEIYTLNGIIEEEMTRLTNISPVLSDMPRGGGTGDKLVDGISKIVELKDELNRMVDEVCELKLSTIRNIKRMENTVSRTILMQRYIYGRTFEEISVSFPYTYNHTCKLHGYALQEYQKMISQDSK